MTALGLVLATGMGCTKAGKFAGTWLFLSDGPAVASGDCYDEDAPTEVASSLGNVDIYGADDGEIVVFTGEVLKGAADGNSFTATYRYDDPGGDTGGSSFQSEELKATLEGGVLKGTYKASYGWDDWTCTGEQKFTATRIDERDTI